MGKEIIINAQASEIDIALLKDGRLVEYTKEESKNNSLVGNIYIGTVKKIMAGLNAAFIDIGEGKEGFLHYLDLGTAFPTINEFIKALLDNRKKLPTIKKMEELPREGNIANILTTGQRILVQVTKEPISTKGARLTGEISLAGRNLVLMPFHEKISVSQKISSKEEKSRLRQLVLSLKPNNYGIIIRTVAEGKKVAEFDNELKILTKRWDSTIHNIQKSKGNELVLAEVNRTESILRDIFTPDYESIHVNEPRIFSEICDYVKLIAPNSKDIVKLYDGELPIFDHFAITKQIKSQFGRTVSFKRGAYLIIEPTEALTVIDVNSGNRTRATQDQETNALEVNLAAAEEIAHQLRLRDIGGIIVIDFIDLNIAENRQILYESMCKLMSDDRARHNILPLSKFCLMQITRHRVRPVITVNTEETCPTCFGSGKIKSSILFTDQIEQKIDLLVNEQGIRNIILQVHPYIEAYLTKGFKSLRRQWKRKYHIAIKIEPIQSLGFLQYKILNKNREEIS